MNIFEKLFELPFRLAWDLALIVVAMGLTALIGYGIFWWGIVPGLFISLILVVSGTGGIVVSPFLLTYLMVPIWE